MLKLHAPCESGQDDQQSSLAIVLSLLLNQHSSYPVKVEDEILPRSQWIKYDRVDAFKLWSLLKLDDILRKRRIFRSLSQPS